MNLFAQIRMELGKAKRWQTLACAVPFVLICYMGLKGYANFEHLFTGQCFLMGMFFLFLSLVKDWQEGKTDILLLVPLGVLLFLATKEPKTFCLTGIAAIFCLRIAYLLSVMFRLDTCFWPRRGKATGESGMLETPLLPFLPSFGCALVIFAFVQMLGTEPIMEELQHYRMILERMWSVIPLIIYMTASAILVGAWLLTETVYHLVCHKFPARMKDNPSMGSIIVLPILAAFLGITTFLLVLMFGYVIHRYLLFLWMVAKDFNVF